MDQHLELYIKKINPQGEISEDEYDRIVFALYESVESEDDLMLFESEPSIQNEDMLRSFMKKWNGDSRRDALLKKISQKRDENFKEEVEFSAAELAHFKSVLADE